LMIMDAAKAVVFLGSDGLRHDGGPVEKASGAAQEPDEKRSAFNVAFIPITDGDKHSRIAIGSRCLIMNQDPRSVSNVFQQSRGSCIK